MPSIVYNGYKSVVSFRANGEPTTRIPSDPPAGGVDNHEFSSLETGSYVVEKEDLAFSAAGITFLNLPVSGSDAYTVQQFQTYLPSLASLQTPVLAHCTSGYRSSAYIVLFVAYQQKKCTSWALHAATALGFSFDVNASDKAVVSFFQEVLEC